jgi:hypothetical protein
MTFVLAIDANPHAFYAEVPSTIAGKWPLCILGP